MAQYWVITCCTYFCAISASQDHRELISVSFCICVGLSVVQKSGTSFIVLYDARTYKESCSQIKHI